MSFITFDGVLRLLQPFSTRLSNIVSRGTIKKVDDTKKLQELQLEVLAGETRDTVERLQSYGFTSVPDTDAECVVVFVGGRRDHGFVVAADDRRYRPTGLSAGEVALYDKTGSKVVLKTNGDIEVTPSSGVVKVVGDVQANGVSLVNHTHSLSAANSPITVAGTVGTIEGNTGGPS